MNNPRPSLEAYMLNLARMAATRATCPRRAVGAILARDGKVVSTGYNGAPPQMRHCFGEGCKNPSGNCINTIHAEANALIRAKEQATEMYCTDTPCINCLKLALAHNPRIIIYFWREYKDDDRDQFVAAHEANGDKISLLQVSLEIQEEMMRTLPPMPGERLV